MATFELIEDRTYRVEGEITQEDVERINAFPIRTCLVLQNTKGQSSDILGQITTDNVYFSVLGGIDYYQKRKYNNNEYIERTKTAPKGLKMVLEYFEQVEAGINSEWTETQKCMYAYNALVEDIDYVLEFDDGILPNGTVPRSLNGVLYNKLTCAGIALTFKEMMDRLGIECYYQNKPHKHDFNVVRLDGELRGIDATWDCSSKNEYGGKCSFNNFGKDPYFYKRENHFIQKEEEETVFDIKTFTSQEFESNYDAIASAINNRKSIKHTFINVDENKRKRFLPVDRFMGSLEDEKAVITKIRLLRQLGTLPEEMSQITDATSSRYGFISDYIGTNHATTNSRNVLQEIEKSNNLGGNLIMRDGQILFYNNENGERKETPLTQEHKETLSPALLSDIKHYYTQYFNTEAPQIDNLFESYSMIESMPPELAQKTATLRAHLYTKIKLFADGDKFFEQLGLPKEEIEVASQKAKSYLESTREVMDDSKSNHENDLDFLYAILQNDVIDTLVAGREYTQEDLAKLIDNVRSNWKDAEFSDDEFKALLDEALSKTMNSEEISRVTLNLGIGIEDVSAVSAEIRETQTNNLQVTQQK